MMCVRGLLFLVFSAAVAHFATALPAHEEIWEEISQLQSQLQQLTPPGQSAGDETSEIALVATPEEERESAQRNIVPADEDESDCPECNAVIDAGQAADPTPKSNAPFCWKNTKTRGVGMPPTICAQGQERIGLFCYKDCGPENRGGKKMKRFGFDCHSTCPESQADQGLFCRSLEYGRGAGYAAWNRDKCEDENPPKSVKNALGEVSDSYPDSFTITGISSSGDAKYTREGEVNGKPAYKGKGVGAHQRWIYYSGATGNRWYINVIGHKGTNSGYVHAGVGTVPWDKTKAKDWQIFTYDHPEQPQVASSASRRLLGSQPLAPTPSTIDFSGFTGPDAAKVNGRFTKAAKAADSKAKDSWDGPPDAKGNRWHLCYLKNVLWIGDQETKQTHEFQWQLTHSCTHAAKLPAGHYHLESPAPGAVPWTQQPAGVWKRKLDTTSGKWEGQATRSQKLEISQVTAGCEKSLAMWYPKCKPGYHPFGCCICRPALPKCGAMGLNGRLDLSCAKKVEITPPKCGQCAPPLEMNGGLITQDGKTGQCGLCYPKCPPNMDGVGPVCWGKPPKGDPKAKPKAIPAWVNCGMGAAASKKACASAVKSQVASVFKMVGKLALIGATAGGSALTEVAAVQMFNKVVSITDKVVSIAMDPVTAGGQEILDTAVESLAPEDVQNAYETAKLLKKAFDAGEGLTKSMTKADIARNAAKLAALMDPSGVSGVVAAYSFPKCHQIAAGGVQY